MKLHYLRMLHMPIKIQLFWPIGVFRRRLFLKKLLCIPMQKKLPSPSPAHCRCTTFPRRSWLEKNLTYTTLGCFHISGRLVIKESLNLFSIYFYEKKWPLIVAQPYPRGLYFEHALIYTTWYFLTFWPSSFWEDILKIPFPYYPPLTLIMTKWHLLKKKKLCG